MDKGTVGELIEELKKYDPEMEIRREDDESGAFEHFSVEIIHAYLKESSDHFHPLRLKGYEATQLVIIY